ncbi:MAG: methylated-DNA--[protein]-cysteine S-methyltransferase [Alphaproteobacteria bacterium]
MKAVTDTFMDSTVSPEADHFGGPEGPRGRDYARLAEAIRFIESCREDQPRLDEVAAHIGLSPAHFQRLFSRWVGVSPKGFLKLLTHAHARTLLAGRASLLDAAYESGLSGPGRLHDLFVTIEAMTPGEVKSGGAGLTLAWGFHDSPFGDCLLIAHERGVTGLAFAGPGERGQVFEDLRSRWPNAAYAHRPEVTAPLIERIFPAVPPERTGGSGPLSVLVGGTEFQHRVWRALLEIPPGAALSYSDIARKVCTGKAVRAVGSAAGRNPISYLIPCHRVLRESAALGGYRWGLTRKRAMLAWEAARLQEATSVRR